MGERQGSLEGVEMTAAFWQDRPTFVTGATGLLGSWLVRRLLDVGADVVCLVRDWVPQSELVSSRLIERAKVIRGDVRDQTLIERVLGEYEIDTILHLAAQTVVTIANRNSLSTFETNIGGTWTILEAARRSPTVKRTVIASSDKAYGNHEELPYHENTPLQGRHPYDVSKSCADLIAQAYAATFGAPVAIARCGNFYGGGDLNWNRIVPGTIRAVLQGKRPVIRSDGNSIRDYVYVEDGVLAYMHLAEQMDKVDVVGQAFNFSNETQVTVLEMVRQILGLMKREDLEPLILDQASNEIRHQYLSAEKARRVLGWRPSFTLLEGLDCTIAWYRKHLRF